MNYAEIKYCDIANGVGVRTTLFVSGCRHHCPGCFNEVAWDFAAGEDFSTEVHERILKSLEPSYVTGLSVLGGEPLEPENQEGVLELLREVREAYPTKSIWMYSGFTWEEMHGGTARCCTPHLAGILECLDVLVDGRFSQDEYDITLRFRGSANQRLIDVPASLAADEIVLWQDEKVFASHSW